MSAAVKTIAVSREDAEVIIEGYEVLKASGKPIPVTFEAFVRALRRVYGEQT